jgi:hypothetical protein
MYISFEELSPQARVWIYQVDRKLNDAEQLILEEAAPAFLESWSTHGKPLRASFRLFHKQFLVLAVDEAVQAASGCAIDSSVAFIQTLEKELELSFTDRTKVAFILDNEVYLEALPALKDSIAAGKITAETQTFNNLISNKQELEEKWLLPAGETWLKRYFS